MVKTIKSQLASLHKLNLWAAGLHATQGVLVVLLSTKFSLPITVSYLTFDAATQSLQPASKVLFNLPLVWLVAAFFFMSAIAHTVVATIGRKNYETGLKRGINRYRWYEYSLSASTMMVAIALLVGIYDLASLLMLFALVMVMNLCGLIMEIHNQTTEKTKWVSYVVGCIAGIVPWVVVGVYFWAAAAFGSGQIPTFVYYIYISAFGNQA